MAVEKIKILGAILELPAKQHCHAIQPILPNFLVNGPNWQCCLAGSSKTGFAALMKSVLVKAAYKVEFSLMDSSLIQVIAVYNFKKELYPL